GGRQWQRAHQCSRSAGPLDAMSATPPRHHFPHECTDEELRAKIDEYAQPLQSGGTTESMRWAPLLQLGLNEQHNRAARRLADERQEEAQRLNATSRRAANVALAVSVASLVFTGVAAYDARDASRS